jgi:hypothetical protein
MARPKKLDAINVVVIVGTSVYNNVHLIMANRVVVHVARNVNLDVSLRLIAAASNKIQGR